MKTYVAPTGMQLRLLLRTAPAPQAEVAAGAVAGQRDKQSGHARVARPHQHLRDFVKVHKGA